MTRSSFPAPLIQAVAEQAMAYPYRRWGFGEDIALRGLVEISLVLDDPRLREFVHDLLRAWCAERAPLTAKDHVAPGLPLLMAYRTSGDEAFLQAARELGALLEETPCQRGVPVHRPDLPRWHDTVWVDCMYMDGPFLLTLWRVTGEDRWLDLGVLHLSSYAKALQDPRTGLFWHGYDTATGATTGHLWGRGNGWALLGLVEALTLLPATHPSRPPLLRTLERQIEAVLRCQHPSGAWHTLLVDPSSPLENSTAALYAAGLLQAQRAGHIGNSAEPARLEKATTRALAHLRSTLQPEGGLLVSAATPIGDRATYAEQQLGVFPWGQGPALLAIAEAARRGRPSP